MEFLILKHIACEGPGLLGDFCHKKGIALEVISLFKGQALPPLKGYDAVIVMGGPMNVYEVEQYPWLAEEDRLLKRALDEDRPVLGFCLGAQLLAKAAGFAVVKNGKKEIGYREITVTEAGGGDPLLRTLAPNQEVFHWHGDRVDLSTDPRVLPLAVSRNCPVQAFRLPGRRAWGIQFHLEVTPPMVREWFREYRREAEHERITIEKELRASLTSTEPLQEAAERFFGAFLEVIS